MSPEWKRTNSSSGWCASLLLKDWENNFTLMMLSEPQYDLQVFILEFYAPHLSNVKSEVIVCVQKTWFIILNDTERPWSFNPKQKITYTFFRDQSFLPILVQMTCSLYLFSDRYRCTLSDPYFICFPSIECVKPDILIHIGYYVIISMDVNTIFLK